MPLPSLKLDSFTFLIADPNPYFQSLLKGVLHAFGARHIQAVGNGNEALELSRTASFDLMFCDCYLPQMDGFDLVQAIRRDNLNQNRYVPIVTLTSHTQENNVARARDCGTSFVLAKPIAPKQLYDRLVWVAEDARPYVVSEGYNGPDRRFKRDDRHKPNTERRGVALPDDAPAPAAITPVALSIMPPPVVPAEAVRGARAS